MSHIDDAFPDIARDTPLWVRSTYLAEACAEVDALRLALAASRDEAEKAKAELAALNDQRDRETSLIPKPHRVERRWVSCPVCGEPDMRLEKDGDGNALILCVNHACASNGGDNSSVLDAKHNAAIKRLEHAIKRSDELYLECEPLRDQLATLAAEVESLRADKERLDWLENFLETDAGMLAEPTAQSPGWELGRNLGVAYNIDGQGESLRAAIDAARADAARKEQT